MAGSMRWTNLNFLLIAIKRFKQLCTIVTMRISQMFVFERFNLPSVVPLFSYSESSLTNWNLTKVQCKILDLPFRTYGRKDDT